jgi:thiol:disulfide interchange protein DsbD
MDLVQVEAHASHEHIRPGDTFQVVIVANIEKGIHINSHQPTDKVLVPTIVSFDERDDIDMAPVSYPQPVLQSFSFSSREIPVYHGRIVMTVWGKLTKEIAVGTTNISGRFSYQACDDKTCFMPQSVNFEIPLKIVDAAQPAKLTKHAIFEQELSLTSEERHAKEVIDKGLPYALIAFFLFGLALNLTPCVYPVVPITVGFFVAQGEQKKRTMFQLASYYVLGIAIIFSVLGLISGLAGRQWGFLFQHPWFVIIISIIILCMAASMFGAFEITVPSFLMTRLGKSRQGTIGSFLMGLTVGVVIAPCAAGIILGLVGIVAKLGIVVKGALLFFVMGLGLGVPYLFLATFSGLMKQLPRSGMWMVWIRKLFGILLVGVAIYFLVPQAKQVTDHQGFYLGVLGIFGGILLGFLEHGEGYTRAFRTFRAVFGVILIVSGTLLANAAIKPEAPGISWLYHTDRSIEDLQKENKPIFIYFYADWCATCRELDRRTFRDTGIIAKSHEFNMLKVNCTTPEKKSKALLQEFEVSGLPTIILLDTKGEELRGLKIVGFLESTELTRIMQQAMKGFMEGLK